MNCKYVKRFGESCTLNENCKYPNCKKNFMTREDLTSRIKPPKFKVGRFVLNEYEAREMLARVAEGTLDYSKIIIEDELGYKATVNKDGFTNRSLYKWDIGSKLTIRKIKANRLNQKDYGKNN
jgi:hypothetical protein